MGTGCIVLSAEAGTFYCLTARHCTEGEDIRVILQSGEKTVQLALLIAFAYERAEDRSTWEIQRLSGNTLLAKQIVEKIMTHVVPPDFTQAIKIFSLFVNIGYLGYFATELKFLSDYFGINELVLSRAIEFCVVHRLGIKRGNYFELSPRILAILLFSKILCGIG